MKNLLYPFFLLVIFSITSNLAIANTPIQAFVSLKDTNTIYHLNSSAASSGFFALPNALETDEIFTFTEDQLKARTNTKQAFAPTRPDFSSAERYALYIPIQNNTNKKEWHIHISHYLIEKVDILHRVNGQTKQISIASTNTQSTSYNINMLGRSAHLNLPPSAFSELIVVLKNPKTKQPLYVGIMSENKYQTWTRNMDFVFIIAIGIVLGFVVLALASFFLAKDQTFLWFAISASLLLCIPMLRSPFGINTFDSLQGVPYWSWLLVGFTLLTLLLFVRSFLAEKAKDTSYFVFTTAIIIIVVVMFIGLFMDNAVNVKLYSISSLLVVILIMLVGLLKALKGGLVEIVFMLGWLPLLYSISYSIFLQTTVPEQGEITLHYHDLRSPYSQVAHLFLHFMAMVLRVLKIKKNAIASEIESHAKTQFLAQISHDLKQPLDTMGLMLQHVQSAQLDSKNQALLAKMNVLQKDMQETFTALIEVSQLESGKVGVSTQTFSLVEVFDELVKSHEDSFRHKGLSLKQRSRSFTLKTDRVLLKRILNNLLSNASKYTQNGGVILSARMRKNHLIVQVWDTGCGIADDQQKSIFTMFERIDTPINHGHGVGLASAKQIASLLGFELSVTSKLNKGSVFSLRIPLDAVVSTVVEPATPQQHSANRAKGLLINTITEAPLASALTEKLSEWGYSCEQAIQPTKDAAENADFTLIFMQANTPHAMADALSNLQNKMDTLSTHTHVACFSEHSHELRRVVAKDKRYYMHILKYPFQPAQVRSLLNAIASQF